MEGPDAKTSNVRSTNSGDDSRKEREQLIAALPKAVCLGRKCAQYQGFWYWERAIPGIISFQRHFRPLDTDIFLATKPRAGSVWLKALAFAIVNRHCYPDLEDHPLLSSTPHELVPFIDKHYANNPFPDLASIPSPRLFATHLAFENLPESVKTSDCRVMYMGRNPLDLFASCWNFFRSLTPEAEDLDARSLEASFDKFCKGIEICGPFLDHVLGYWKASQEMPDKVLFLKYEDVKQHPNIFVKRIAEFLGCPFSFEEENEGTIEKISRLCSFENLEPLEINRRGTFNIMSSVYENKLFFRKGEVGDWVNLLSPSMAQRYEDIMRQKFGGSGLAFDITTP